MPPLELDGPDALRGAVGADLGPTDWLEITQDRVNAFADATGDHQWIHTDPQRAARESPFGGTIAHGHLTLSLVAFFLPQLATVSGFSMGVNYGSNKVRFPAPVPVGSRIRATGRIAQVDEVPGGMQFVTAVTIHVDGSDKPACVAEVISRYVA